MASKNILFPVAWCCLSALAAAAGGCTGEEVGPGYDINMDVDFDMFDAAGEDAAGTCRLDYDCSDGIFCNGIEKCVEGVCQAGAEPTCDDTIACTADSCDEDFNACRHDYSDALCDDGNVCNGLERCFPVSPFADAATGCIPGSPVYCDDVNDCTEDFCDPESGQCRARLKDADGDGHGDRQCFMIDDEGNRVTGDDCNDSDPDIHAGAEEVCDDGIDNNCDRMVDLFDPRCLPDNDTCASPTEIPAGGGSVTGSTRGTADDYTTGCGGTSKIDVVFLLHLMEDHDVGLSALGDFRPAVISVRTVCGDAASELYCAEDTLWARGLEAGDYFIIVEGATAGSFNLSVELAPYTNVYNVPPTNDDCTAPYVIPPEGGLFIGATTGMANDFTASCGGSSESPDAVFELTLDDRKVVQVSTETNYDGTIHMHSSPCDGGAEIACNDDYSDTRHSQFTSTVNAGIYYIIVDGFSTSYSGNYEMNVVITSPP
jgi:hypothetical protein